MKNSNKETKVKYKKNEKVSIEMCGNNYSDLLKSYNDLRDILNTMSECNDLWLSDIQKLETLRYRMSTLGFVEGAKWYSNARLPKGGGQNEKDVANN